MKETWLKASVSTSLHPFLSDISYMYPIFRVNSWHEMKLSYLYLSWYPESDQNELVNYLSGINSIFIPEMERQ